MVRTNHSLSVDCVIFGFDGKSLKALLTQRSYCKPNGTQVNDMKLPGRMIFENESLSLSADKIVRGKIGNTYIKLSQLHIFSDPGRVTPEELRWINEYHGIDSDRVVTVAYYGAIKLDTKLEAVINKMGDKWVDVDSIRSLAMDHKEILSMALDAFTRQMLQSPIAFELLPRRFTIRQLQNIYSAVLGIEIDNRNFRKKILTSGMLIPTGEKECGVAHKPAEFYLFNRKAYDKSQKERYKLRFINYWN